MRFDVRTHPFFLAGSAAGDAVLDRRMRAHPVGSGDGRPAVDRLDGPPVDERPPLEGDAPEGGTATESDPAP